MTNRVFSYAAVVAILALSLMYSVDAEAVLGQRYFGDGSTPDGAGGLTYTSAADSSCLVCHVPDNAFGAPVKISYLRTGHRNALRRATVNSFWSGSDSLTYDTDLTGHVILWNTPGPISFGTPTFPKPPTLDGSCSLSGYLNQSACQSAGGTWTSANNSLFYIYGGWINTVAGAGAVNDPSTSIAAPGAVTNGGSYPCARCHTTGMTLDTAVSTTRQPDKIYPGINGHVNFDPDGNGPATTVSWASGFSAPFQTLEGVQCERCHDATRHFISGPTTQRGVNATALCLQCHRQERTVTYTSGGRGANIHPTPFSDNGALPVSEPTYTLAAIEVGRTDGSYGQVFFGYSTGMEYLNSVHGRFAGNFQQINDPSKYISGFSFGSCDLDGFIYFPDQASCEPMGGSWSDARGCIFDKATCEVNTGIWTVSQGGCTSCHDVHNSLFDAAQAGSALKTKCTDCHTGQTPGAGVAPQVTVAGINHPQTPGTPFDTSRFDDVCAVCHMATQAVSNGDQISMPAHIWRINSSATYTTWPSIDQFNGTNGEIMDKRARMVPEVYTLPDGVSSATYTNAVWVDLDLACGQCHGGSKGGAGVTNGAPLRTKAELASSAAIMHGKKPVPSFTYSASTTTNYLVNFDASPTVCPTGGCSYAWDFGDTATGTGVTASHTYAGTTPVPVKLTVTHNALSGSITHVVTPSPVNRAPVALGLRDTYTGTTTLNATPITNAGMTASFTDRSTDQDNNVKTVTVMWGDGGISTAVVTGTTFTHNYTKAGTFTITHTVTDTGGKGNSEKAIVKVVPPKVTVTGTITDSNTLKPLSGVKVTMQKGTTIRTATTAYTGNYKFTNTMPGTWTITATKLNYTFTGSPTTISAPTATIVSAITGSHN